WRDSGKSITSSGSRLPAGRTALSQSGIQRRGNAGVQLDDAHRRDQPGGAERIQPLFFAGRNHTSGATPKSGDGGRSFGYLWVISALHAEDSPRIFLCGKQRGRTP